MPRHRIEAPRQRTLWRTAEQSARRVRFRAAGRREPPGHAKPPVAPQWRQRLTRNQRRMLKRAGRRLLVSPWFAAGAGVVIATGVIIYTPHAKLNPAITIHHCKELNCRSQPVIPATGPGGLPAGTGGEPVTLPPKSGSVLAGMTFSYQVVERTGSDFSMLITIRAPHSLGAWTLSFVILTATDVYVVPGEARWQPSGPHGGTASSLIASTESAAYAEIVGHESGVNAGSTWTGDVVQLQVRGTGTPSAPAHCFYDGVACSFVPSHSQQSASWPGSR